MDAKQFPYGIGVEYDGRKIDDDLEVVTIPANTYAVFRSKGKMPDAFIDTYHRIVTEFFPQSSQYEYAENVENVAELLMSEKGAFITGSTFLIDGGATSSSYYYGPLKPEA